MNYNENITGHNQISQCKCSVCAQKLTVSSVYHTRLQLKYSEITTAEDWDWCGREIDKESDSLWRWSVVRSLLWKKSVAAMGGESKDDKIVNWHVQNEKMLNLLMY